MATRSFWVAAHGAVSIWPSKKPAVASPQTRIITPAEKLTQRACAQVGASGAADAAIVLPS